jgi:DEAD/DEAH box helicase domain-containing protein
MNDEFRMESPRNGGKTSRSENALPTIDLCVSQCANHQQPKKRRRRPHQQQEKQQRQQQPNSSTADQKHPLIRSLSLLDPILQFLTKASGHAVVPLSNLHATIPTLSEKIPWEHVYSLIQYGILQVDVMKHNLDGNSIVGYDDTKRNNNPSTSNFCIDKGVLQNEWTNSVDGVNPTSTMEHSLSLSSKKVSSTMMICLGFPSGEVDKNLCGSTKSAATRRLAALKRRIKKEGDDGGGGDRNDSGTDLQDIAGNNRDVNINSSDGFTSNGAPEVTPDQRIPTKDWTLPTAATANSSLDSEPILEMERQARSALKDVLGLSMMTTPESRTSNSEIDNSITSFSTASVVPAMVLPDQVSYAGSHPAQDAEYEDSNNNDDDDDDDDDANNSSSNPWKGTLLHPIVRDSLLTGRQLYRHQAEAIQSALNDQHTLVCTGTGSGKSLCYLIPVLQRAVADGKKSLLLFPTKALAQDQLVKLQGILCQYPDLAQHVQAATLDGDTPHSQRSLICSACNVILTNPDTLHASILPNWTNQYKELLQDIKYVVIDEAHTYEGVFGAHVAMILARLYRVHCCCISTLSGNDDRATSTDNTFIPSTEDGGRCTIGDCDQLPAGGTVVSTSSASIVYLACSATLPHPEHHFRLLCCIPSSHPVTVLTKDASPRAAKHFWVWNPPLLDEHGKSLGIVRRPLSSRACSSCKQKTSDETSIRTGTPEQEPILSLRDQVDGNLELPDIHSLSGKDNKHHVGPQYNSRRRHSADETALLLAKAISRGVRCIAFCKTRCLVEWVFERCIAALKESPETEKLISKVDSYRGGYSKTNRREIEDKLFHNKLLGVVGTSALELGVDIGGVDLTLHCGFPSSHASLMQQAGRAGRGAAARHRPSLAICVCFNSPVDQHLWRHPASLLSRGLATPLSMPIYPGLVQGHLLCAGNEWPLVGRLNASAIQNVDLCSDESLLSDEDLFGSREVYAEALENLISQGSLSPEKIHLGSSRAITIFKTHPSIKHPSTKTSIRSIESVNYDIIDLNHPMQNGRMDGSHHEGAVLGKFNVWSSHGGTKTFFPYSKTLT